MTSPTPLRLEAAQALAPSRQADPVLGRLPDRAAVYCVGGAVRDALMGWPSGDRDFMVTGLEPQDMVDAGFRPVGKDFPVFLHPVSHEEYALARTERKSGRGYHGFVVYAGADVTLEEDLGRRDLTINAMAVGEDGLLQDPLGGQQDLLQGLLRHIRESFEEDPVRVLRLARFAARWPDLSVADDTADCCRRMAATGEMAELVAERVWQELERGLAEAAPLRMIELLQDWCCWTPAIGGRPRTPDELAALAWGLARTHHPALRAALLWRADLPSRLGRIMPREVQDWLRILQSGLAEGPADGPAKGPAERPTEASATALLNWSSGLDLFRRPERLDLILPLLARPLSGRDEAAIRRMLAAPMGPVAAQAAKAGVSVPQAVWEARLALLDDSTRNA